MESNRISFNSLSNEMKDALYEVMYQVPVGIPAKIDIETKDLITVYQDDLNFYQLRARDDGKVITIKVTNKKVE